MINSLTRFLKRLLIFRRASFARLNCQENIFLYAGSIGQHTLEGPIPFIGLSLDQPDHLHLKHDVRKKLPLKDNSVSIYQSEDVFEHVEYECLPSIIDEIFRILKPGGLLRLSLPDYRCDIIAARTMKDSSGNIIFDPGGGGSFQNRKVVNGGHLWFPTFESIDAVMQKSKFAENGTVNYLHYYDSSSNSVTKEIDYSKGVVRRTPDHDKRVQSPYRAMSIVIDAYKSEGR